MEKFRATFIYITDVCFVYFGLKIPLSVGVDIPYFNTTCPPRTTIIPNSRFSKINWFMFFLANGRLVKCVVPIYSIGVANGLAVQI